MKDLSLITTHKLPPCFALCRLNFDIPLSSVATLPQSLLPSRPHSWLPSTNLLTLPWLSYTFSPPPSFSPPPFSLLTARTFLPPLSPLLLYMPIIYPYSCYIGLQCTISTYTGFATIATPCFRFWCSAVLMLKMKKTTVTVTFILISGRAGEPLTSSNGLQTMSMLGLHHNAEL